MYSKFLVVLGSPFITAAFLALCRELCRKMTRGSFNIHIIKNATHERTIIIHPSSAVVAHFEYSGRIYCRHMNETNIYLLLPPPQYQHQWLAGYPVDICGFNLVEEQKKTTTKKKRSLPEEANSNVHTFSFILVFLLLTIHRFLQNHPNNLKIVEIFAYRRCKGPGVLKGNNRSHLFLSLGMPGQ